MSKKKKSTKTKIDYEEKVKVDGSFSDLLNGLIDIPPKKRNTQTGKIIKKNTKQKD
jgi:hypothetical protein